MPFHGQKHGKITAWRARAEAELQRLAALTGPQLAAELLRLGFAGLPSDGERTRIGLSNSLCPEPPAVVGGNDIDIVQRYNALLLPALTTLEDSGLLQSEPRGRSSLLFYRLTERGRSALADGDTEALLSASP